MDSQKRLLLALALSFVLTAVYMMLTPQPAPEGGLDGGVDGSVLLADGGTLGETDPRPVARTDGDGGIPTSPTIAAGPPGEPALPLRELPHDEQVIHYKLSTKSASLVKAELQGWKMREQHQLGLLQSYKLLFGGDAPASPQMDMALPPDTYPASLAVAIKGEHPVDPWRTWAFDEAASSGDTFVFTAKQGSWELKKTLRWTDSPDPKAPAHHGFELAMIIEAKNTSSASLSGELGLHYGRAVDPKHEEKASLFGGVGNESKATCAVGGDMHHLVPAQGQPNAEDLSGPLAFVGVDQQYFLGVIFPLGAARPGRCEMHATPTSRVAVGWWPITVGPGETVRQSFGVYVGPKDVDYLNQEPTALVNEAGGEGGAPAAYKAMLAKTVNFGIWEVICVVLLAILKFFHGLFANWGLAIVMLTVTVKMALLPLTYKSMVAAESMKKLQPKMLELKAKYGEDREKLNMETMKLYQEAKVNPLGGCFPMLLQMPVWIALFTTLRNSYEIYREPFFGPVWSDLTYKDPTYLFPLLLGVTMIITQKLQPATMDPAQQRIMTWLMPILFTGMMIFYPAGLTLYIFTNNLLSIGQQFAIRKWMKYRGIATAPAMAAPKK